MRGHVDVSVIFLQKSIEFNSVDFPFFILYCIDSLISFRKQERTTKQSLSLLV